MKSITSETFDWDGKDVPLLYRSYFTSSQSGLISSQQLSFTQNFLAYNILMMLGRSIKKVLLVGFNGEKIFHFRQLFKCVQVSDFVLF